jgi:hypothetical protein
MRKSSSAAGQSLDPRTFRKSSVKISRSFLYGSSLDFEVDRALETKTLTI